MTDEEMAKESLISYRKEPKWAGKMFMQDENICYKDGFLAGLEADRPKWHDLRKNPKDLPLKKKDYITNIGVMTFTSLHDRFIWTTPLCEACDYYEEVTDEVIAWCEIPKYTEE